MAWGTEKLALAVSWVWCSELGVVLIFPTSAQGCVTEGMQVVPIGDLQVGQLADSLLCAWVQDLTSAREGQTQSYVLCVPAPSQRCKDMLQPYGPIMLLFTEENWVSMAVWGQKLETCLAFAVFTEY